ncbi:MAG: NYN domain-containing protein [Gloeomargarita sp. SZTDM-1c_bins_89]
MSGMDNVGLFTPQQVLENRGRIAIFIDGSNLFYAALQLGIEIDYSKLLCYLTAGSRLLRAFFYTGVDPTNEKQQGFLLWMRRNGYRVVCKELVQLPDGSKKANLDVEIAVDMLSLVGSYDTAILVSGDGDLAYAVDAVSYRGVRVEVVSLRSMTSDNLINVADRYIDLETIRDEIRKANRPTPYRSVAEMVNNDNNNANDNANPSRN